MTATLYDRLGGQEAIRATVAKLYEKILGDDRISFFFSDIDIDKLRRMNTEFVSMAFGAPHHHSGKSLSRAHSNAVSQGMSDMHFDVVKEHLKDAMGELAVEPKLIEEGLAIIEGMRNDVLGR